MNDESQQWFRSLQRFINEKLKIIIPDPLPTDPNFEDKRDEAQLNRNQYLGKEAIQIWAKAFTHESYSFEDSNEDLEYAGDAMLKWAFPRYLRFKFPFFHKKNFTFFNSYYMSGVRHKIFSEKLGLPKYVRIRTDDQKVNANVAGDLFESFFGALEEVSDMIAEGLGTVNSYNMLVQILSDVEWNMDIKDGDPKTILSQMFQRFGKPTPALVLRSDPNRKPVTYEIDIGRQNLEFLRGYGFNLKSSIVGSGTAFTKKEAEFKAYDDAYSNLKFIGVTLAWAEELKRKLDFDIPELRELKPLAEQKLKMMGYSNFMRFFTPRKTNAGEKILFQLMGKQIGSDREKPLTTIMFDRKTPLNEMRRQILEKFINEE